MGGIYYQIVIRMDDDSIKLIIDKNKELNKKIFDYLYEKKDEIEEVFGSEINWKRMDNQVSSRIEHDMDCCGLDDEPTPDGFCPKLMPCCLGGVVKEGDVIVAKDREDEATLLANGNVMADGEEKSMQAWLKGVYGWASVHTYVFAVHKKSGRTLSEIREEYMEKEKNEFSGE